LLDGEWLEDKLQLASVEIVAPELAVFEKA
jgi:hypothetical protein